MKLYTIDCPACRVLENKLTIQGFSYEKIYDEKLFQKLGYIDFPLLELDDGKVLNFLDAIAWLKEEKT